jgi:hypothetical protein
VIGAASASDRAGSSVLSRRTGSEEDPGQPFLHDTPLKPHADQRDRGSSH